MRTVPRSFSILCYQVSLKLQKRLAASVMKCGKGKIWLDPNEVNEISLANSRQNIRKVNRTLHVFPYRLITCQGLRVEARPEANFFLGRTLVGLLEDMEICMTSDQLLEMQPPNIPLESIGLEAIIRFDHDCSPYSLLMDLTKD